MAASSDLRFTARQREVLGFLAAGCTNWDIALALGISLDGAKWHVREVMSLLNVDSREDAAAYWRSERSVTNRVSRALGFSRWGTAIRVTIGVGTAAGIAVAGITVWALIRGGEADVVASDSPATVATLGSATVETPTPPAAASSATTFLFLGSSLDLHPQRPTNASFAEVALSLRAFVGDKLCARASLIDPAARDADGNVPLVVGLPNQPPECGAAGATVVFATSNGSEMFIRGTVSAGTLVRIQNIAGLPTDQPGPQPPFPAEETIVFVSLPNFLRPSDHVDPLDVTVFADGQRCMRVARGDGDWARSGYIAVPLGRSGQPAACSQTGAYLLGYDQDGNQLLVQNDPHMLAPLTWMYMSGIVDTTAPTKSVSELGPIDTAWP